MKAECVRPNGRMNDEAATTGTRERWIMGLAVLGLTSFILLSVGAYQASPAADGRVDTSIWRDVERIGFPIGALAAIAVVLLRRRTLATGLLLGLGVVSLVHYALIGRTIELGVNASPLREALIIGAVGGLILLGGAIASSVAERRGLAIRAGASSLPGRYRIALLAATGLILAGLVVPYDRGGLGSGAGNPDAIVRLPNAGVWDEAVGLRPLYGSYPRSDLWQALEPGLLGVSILIVAFAAMRQAVASGLLLALGLAGALFFLGYAVPSYADSYYSSPGVGGWLGFAGGLGVLFAGVFVGRRAEAEETLARARRLIVPGRRIGPVAVGMTPDQVVAVRGRPDEEEVDAFSTVYTYNDERLTVEFSRVPETTVFHAITFDWRYRTREGIGAGASGNDVIRVYGDEYERLHLRDPVDRVQLTCASGGLDFLLTPENEIEAVAVADPHAAERQPRDETANRRVCTTCGTALVEGARFCATCGAPTAADETGIELPVGSPSGT